jgi:hypothetical protein
LLPFLGYNNNNFNQKSQILAIYLWLESNLLTQKEPASNPKKPIPEAEREKAEALLKLLLIANDPTVF